MILRIARKEMTEMFRDGRFRVSGAILFTLLAGALLLGWQNYKEVRAQHDVAQKSTRDQWLHQGRKNPHSAAHYGVYAFKPKSPLSLVDQGTDPYTGIAVWLEAHKQNEFRYRPAQDATAVQRFGELTGATVLQLLVPLLIVLLTFNAFAGERELGTLRQLLSLGVRQTDLAAGKALGVAGALALLLIPAAVFGAAAMTGASGYDAMTSAIPRTAWLALSYLLYFGAFLGISLTVSALVKSSRAALTVLLGFWMFNGLIAPRAASDIARAVRPTPSAFEFGHKLEMALASGADGADPTDGRVARLKADLLLKYNVDKVEALPVNFNGIRLQDGENHGNIVFDKAYAALWETFSQQDAVHRALGMIAPGLTVRSLSMGFAGSDFPHHAHFAIVAENYRRMIQRTLNEDMILNAGNTSPYLADDSLWNKVPPFLYTAPATSWVVARQTPALGIMAGWFVIAMLAAAWSSRRLKAL
ncbi:MAG: family transporter protein [Bryobacterales bacterium]|nr:family transporter protein [Bryobacterales bacterium]